MKIHQILKNLEERAPRSAAEPWDNVGLLVGDAQEQTRGVVVSVDLTWDAIAEAKKKGYRAILNHHPCIFPKGKGPSAITADAQDTSSLIYKCIQEGISVIATHTNFDQCALEVVESISQAMGVTPKGRIQEKAVGSLVKLVVFVPQDHLDAVRTAVLNAGAGHIGQYDQCAFVLEGTGSFRALEGADPFLGKVQTKEGPGERVQEARLETVVPRTLLKQVLVAMESAHPYEEVAYDIYPVEQAPAGKGVIAGLGYGFYGSFEKPLSARVFSERVKKTWGVKNFLATQFFPEKVSSFAFTPGKGSSFVRAVAAKKVDVYITGEVGYHSAMEATRLGLAVIELGHRESEYFYLKTASSWVKELGLKCSVLNVPTQKMR